MGLQIMNPLSKFLPLVLCLLPVSTMSQPDFMHQLCYTNEGYYTASSAYRKNLNTLLSSSSLPSNAAINSGFYNLSIGQDPDQVYAMVLCRGDTSLDDCQSCLTNATIKIIQVCPNQKHAIGVYGSCMLRYSSRPIYGVLEEAPSFYGCNVNDAANVTEFSEILGWQLQRLQTAAASSNNLLKFATGTEKMGPSDTLYALVQCSRDLSIQDCKNCLNNCVSSIQDYCAGKIGLHMIKPSCSTLFELFPFYKMTEYEITNNSAPHPVSSPGLEQFPASAPPSLPPPTAAKGKGGDKITSIILPIVVGTVIILVVAICIFSRAWKQKLRKNVEFEEFSRFDLATIKTATANFCEENKLGQGGFGAVYKGTLDNGQDIAVKRLSNGSRQGDQEFKNEVGLLAKLQHRNLVRLLGYCLDGKERLLIYEFLVNGSLDHFIYDSLKRDQLNWLRRFEIIMGIARGLLYLHEDSRLRIIHRDLKASNILLDGEMNPKISDFGLARLFETDQSEGKTSKIAGTYGYMAPEYAVLGQFSVKSDVFSFGVILLEIVSGRRNAENLLNYAWKNWIKGASANVIDPALRTRLQTEMVKCIHIGLLCVQENVADRPTMATIVHMLNSSSLSLPIPSQPAFFVESTTGSDRSSALSYNSGMSRITQSNEGTLPLSRKEASIYESPS